MNNSDKNLYLNRYNERLSKYGYDAKSLGWGGGKERQNLRFKILSEIGIQPDDSVLDVGCGFADMFGYLKSTGWNGKYTGVDINPNLLKIAMTKYPQAITKEVDILITPIEETFTWVVSSGLFNARLHYESNVKYNESMLKKMFELSNKGIACDFMSTYVDFQHPDAYHTNPCDIIKLGKTITSGLCLRMDYLPYEFCVYLYKMHF